MARKPNTSPTATAARKTRTREHVIASQSVVHVERFIVAAGHTVERVVHDYGYDLMMSTFRPNGAIEPGNILIQLKATDNLRVLRDGKTISYSVEWADLALWREELMPVILIVYPVILIVYDVTQEIAYWLYVQQFCETSARLQTAQQSGKVTVHLSKENVVDVQAIQKFRQFKHLIFDQTKGTVKHHG